jgi:hypothetical protein
MPLWFVTRKLALLACTLFTALLPGYALMDIANRQTIRFTPISDPITNPLMGWAPWATIAESQQPHTLVYVDLTWRDFEPRQGVYDFDRFEKEQQLARWRAENVRVVFRFVCDYPAKDRHMDIPDWLFAEIHGDGDYYYTSYGRGFSPNYANPLFIQRHQQAIRALGERYGQDDFFAFIELGSLGHWGEWHVRFDAGIRPLPPAEIRDQYVRHYREAFPNTLLLLRRPFAIAKQLNLGLFNDVTGSPDETNRWLAWIASGGAYDQTGEPNGLSAMPNAWRAAPVGGEFTSDLSSEELYGRYLDRTLGMVEQSHMTFIGPNSPYKIEPGGPLQPGIDRLLSRMGYRIYIQRLQLPRRVSLDRTLRLSLTFANAGIAPMYYNWPVELTLFDRRGAVVKTFRPTMDLRQILPGQPCQVSFALPLGWLENGDYSIGFAILDPHTSQPAVRLAMANPRQDLVQLLGHFEVKRLFQ